MQCSEATGNLIFTMKDLDTNRVYLLYDFRKKHVFKNGKIYCVSGKVNSSDKFYLVLENSKEDIKHSKTAI
jgi:hypothetical protein